MSKVTAFQLRGANSLKSLETVDHENKSVAIHEDVGSNPIPSVDSISELKSTQIEQPLKASQYKKLKIPILNVADFDEKDITILGLFLENYSFIFPLLMLELRQRKINLNPETIRKRLDRKLIAKNLIIKIDGCMPATYNINHYAIGSIKKLIKDFNDMLGLARILGFEK